MPTELALPLELNKSFVELFRSEISHFKKTGDVPGAMECVGIMLPAWSTSQDVDQWS